MALSTTSAPVARSRPREGLSRVLRAILGIPIFYKVLVANSAIVVLGAILGTWVTLEQFRTDTLRSSGELAALFAIAGIALCVLVNFLVLKAAFLPLASLEHTVETVRRGNVNARAPHVPFGDPEVDQLIDTMNSMLDGIETHREQVRLLSRQVLTAQEEERQRIARELHDETAQSLTSLLIGLRVLEKASNPQEIAARIAELRAQTALTLEEVRKMAVDLRPSTLDDLGLAAALQWYTTDFARRSRAEVSFKAAGLDERLPDEVEVVVYRIIQEALTNVLKHAEATRVAVEVVREGNVVLGSIWDNGRGFDVEAMLRSRQRGLGLFGMRERVALVGGSLEIASKPDAYTRVALRIPLEG